jgi:diguanylate cyclase (GGDEF)-like protein
MVSERILFVDDDPVARNAFSRAMRQRGFLIDVARDGSEAWQLASQFPYAAVVTDVRMPGIDGLKLVDQLKGLEKAPSCLLVSGVPQVDWGGSNPDPRGIPVIRKPWDGDHLALALTQAVQEFAERNEAEVMSARSVRAGRATRVLLIQGGQSSDKIAGLMRESSALEYEVTTSVSVEAALKVLGRHRFDVCLLDLTGKPLSAASMIERMRIACASLPVVVFSPDEYEELALRVMAAGAQDYLCSSELDGRGLRRALRYAIERRRAMENLDDLAHKDALTQLANRNRIRQRLGTVLATAGKDQQRVGLMFLDLDNFKTLIDGFGHGVGDQVLQEVARRLRASVRDSDTVGRMGGDEFAVVLENLKRSSDATQLAQRILNSFATPFSVGESSLSLTASIGICLFPENGADADELMRNADAALYRAKDAGRNNYQYFGDEVRKRVEARLDLENELRRAVEKQELVLHYQPRVSLLDNGVMGSEALLRWKRAGGTLALPVEFLHVLEDTGLIVQVGRWVLEQALLDVAQIRKQGHQSFTMAVNVSARQFESDDFGETVECALAAARLPNSALEIELTEPVLMLDTKGAKRSMGAVRDLDVKLVVDNFGTGACPLGFLKRLPVKALKVARPFAAAVTKNPDDAAIVSATVALADSLGLEVGANGIEDASQMEALKTLGCESAQGFHISRPRALPELIHFIATWSGTRTTPPPGGQTAGGYSVSGTD